MKKITKKPEEKTWKYDMNTSVAKARRVLPASHLLRRTVRRRRRQSLCKLCSRLKLASPISFSDKNVIWQQSSTGRGWVRGTSILGEVRNVEISRATQQLPCSKSHYFLTVFALALVFKVLTFLTSLIRWISLFVVVFQSVFTFSRTF